MDVHVLDYCSNLRVIGDMTMFLNEVILLSSLTNTISRESNDDNIHTNILLWK